MEPTLIPCQIACADEPLRTETVLYECGLRVITFATTSAELLMQLVSTYTGDDRLPRAIVSEAIEPPGADSPALRTREISVPPGFATHERDVALADHLAAFCDLAARAQGEAVEVVGRATLDQLPIAHTYSSRPGFA